MPQRESLYPIWCMGVEFDLRQVVFSCVIHNRSVFPAMQGNLQPKVSEVFTETRRFIFPSCGFWSHETSFPQKPLGNCSLPAVFQLLSSHHQQCVWCFPVQWYLSHIPGQALCTSLEIVICR